MRPSVIALLLILSLSAHCQYNETDGINLTENGRSDTVTVYKFMNRTILTTQIPEAKKESNFSLRGKGFRLLWSPVCNRTKEGVESFADLCVRDEK